jgi:hypothetical protein
MKKDDLSVDVIPEGKENEYLTLEQSNEVRRRAKLLLPSGIIFIGLFIAFSVDMFIEFPLWITVLLLIVTGMNLLYFVFLFYSLGKYISKVSKTT